MRTIRIFDTMNREMCCCIQGMCMAYFRICMNP